MSSPTFRMHAAGVSLMLNGVAISNDGFVDVDDVFLFGNINRPSNANSNGAVLCTTDLEDCCAAPRTVRGDWYYPDGRRVGSSGSGFLVNRGPNDQQANGSVRLFRRFSGAPEKGRFRCELPNAADSNVNQILYVNICEFVTCLM